MAGLHRAPRLIAAAAASAPAKILATQTTAAPPAAVSAFGISAVATAAPTLGLETGKGRFGGLPSLYQLRQLHVNGGSFRAGEAVPDLVRNSPSVVVGV